MLNLIINKNSMRKDYFIAAKMFLLILMFDLLGDILEFRLHLGVFKLKGIPDKCTHKMCLGS